MLKLKTWHYIHLLKVYFTLRSFFSLYKNRTTKGYTGVPTGSGICVTVKRATIVGKSANNEPDVMCRRWTAVSTKNNGERRLKNKSSHVFRRHVHNGCSNGCYTVVTETGFYISHILPGWTADL